MTIHTHAKGIAGTAFLSILLAASGALAQEGSVTIHSPQDGATHDAGKPLVIEYSVNPGPSGDHVHIYVDADEVAIVRQLEGSHTLKALAPGMRNVCIKVVNKAHVPIGVEGCVNIDVVAAKEGAMEESRPVAEPPRMYGY